MNIIESLEKFVKENPDRVGNLFAEWVGTENWTEFNNKFRGNSRYVKTFLSDVREKSLEGKKWHDCFYNTAKTMGWKGHKWTLPLKD